MPFPGDNVHYYAVALLAGQTITVQLDDTDPTTGLHQVAAVGVFDPDDRLIATDYSVDTGSGVYGFPTLDKPFQIKTTMPGTYRFAMEFATDGDCHLYGTGHSV